MSGGSQGERADSSVSLLPSGTVTFLFTDIEGSTSLAQAHPDEMPRLLARHHALLRQAVKARHGHVFRIVGDALCAAFSTAHEALEAAISSQRQIVQEDWGPAELKVRMGIHSGVATADVIDERADPYSGYSTLARVQRVMSAAQGGQVLVSNSTAELVREDLPAGVTLKDMGAHRLKGFPQAEHLWQVVAPGLADGFPPIASATPTRPLPLQSTTFVGREQELAEIKRLLRTTRLLTLTGPGGSGKTRLALQIAAESAGQFRDGCFFVPFAALRDPALVASTIARTLGVTESAGRPIADSLEEYLQSKELLLVLDNFEQVIPASTLLGELLSTCPQLTLLVTSREGLRVTGEREFPVPPLALPNPRALPPLDALTSYPAIALFVDRAQAIKPDFRLTDETAPVVAAICYRLEGLPLAIELAAARIKLLPPRALLARLEHRLEFLTGGARDLPVRQQTLRNTIAWSYDLLDDAGKRLFRRLSVFVGGLSMEAAEAVAGDSYSMLDELSSLIDKSLLGQAEGLNGEPRFLMLEMLREFGGEQLAASGEQESVRRRHAEYFLALAESAGQGVEQAEWINRVEQDHDNLRAALEWSREARDAGALCLRLAVSLAAFWEVRGYFSEGRQRLSAILAIEAAQGATQARAHLLARAAELAYRQSDYPATLSLAGESLAISREIGDKQGVASALVKIGNAATEAGDYEIVPSYLEEALEIWRELGDKHGIARALLNLGFAALRSGDTALARERLEEALALLRELGDKRSIGFALSGLGEAALRAGDRATARRLLEESLNVRREIGNKWGVGVSLGGLGWVAIREGDGDGAIERLRESIEVRQEIGDKGGIAWCLEKLSEIALARGQADRAARLCGGAAALRESIGSVIDPADQPESDQKLADLRARLGEERFAALLAEGRALSMDRAIEYGLDQDAASS